MISSTWHDYFLWFLQEIFYFYTLYVLQFVSISAELNTVFWYVYNFSPTTTTGPTKTNVVTGTDGNNFTTESSHHGNWCLINISILKLSQTLDKFLDTMVMKRSLFLAPKIEKSIKE